MDSEVYLLIVVASIAGLWFVWDLGVKKFFLDGFRERLFELRFRLFQLGASGDLPFDNEAYRAIETLLCGLLRHGHRVTFMVFILSVREQRLRKRDDEFIDYSKQIELKISRTPFSAQEKLRGILTEVHHAVTIYIAVRSLLFMVTTMIFVCLRALNLFRRYGKREISAVLESEAYRAESFHRPSSHAALA